jgi:hypothetical protein
VESKSSTILIEVKYWQLITKRLSASGLSWGCSSEIDATGCVLYTADAYRKDGKRFTVVTDDRLTAFLELEKVTQMTSMGEREEN